ncbi:hypothetical protein ACFPRL_21690 [Pseudoclavibacter helvolus]
MWCTRDASTSMGSLEQRSPPTVRLWMPRARCDGTIRRGERTCLTAGRRSRSTSLAPP